MTRQTSVQAAFAAAVVDEWARAGVRDAVISPGSRSTPLVLALAHHDAITTHVRLDERSAGFFALGIGLESARPVVVLTTSGTAAAELHPSVLEAHHSGVPLIVCTADRPPELHGVGAPQTIEQTGLFGAAVRWSAEPGVADVGVSRAWRSLAARSAMEATVGPFGPGPVHLNLAFRDPLVSEPSSIPSGRSGGAPWHAASSSPTPPSADVIEQLLAPNPASQRAPSGLRPEIAGRRGVIIAGSGAGDPGDLVAMADALGWPLLADPRSGARTASRNVIAAADALLRVRVFADSHEPEVIVCIGAPWASRVVNDWIADLASRQVEQYLVDPWWRWADPARVATRAVRADPGSFCRAVAGEATRRGMGAGACGSDSSLSTAGGNSWLAGWKDADDVAQDVMDQVLVERGELCGPAVARRLVRAMDGGCDLVVSSSMAIRNVEWFGPPVADPPRILSNRGVNGIDGVVSTALGVSASSSGNRPVVALLGDLAFLHDCSALASVDTERIAATLVIVDNAGGGIFSFLPQAKVLEHDDFERFFATPAAVDVGDVARAFCAAVIEVSSAAELVHELVAAHERRGLAVVIVRVSREQEVEVHDEIAKRVGELL